LIPVPVPVPDSDADSTAMTSPMVPLQPRNTTPIPHIKAIQVNLQKRPLANTELLQYTKQNNIDILLIQEPHILSTNREIPQTGYNQIGKSNVIILTRTGIHYKTIHDSQNVVAILINQTLIINVYAAPLNYKRSLSPLLWEIEKIMHTNKRYPVLLCGDFNTGTILFKTTKKTHNSILFDEFIISNALALHNYEAPTWFARGLSSTVDYTLTKRTDLENWKISNHYSQSDHVYIEFNIPGIPMLTPNKNINTQINADKFKELITIPPLLLPYTTTQNTETNAVTLNQWIATALENSTTTRNATQKPHYWNPTLQALQKEIRNLHKKSNKVKHKPHLRQRLLTQKRQHQREYKAELKKAKTQTFRDFITCTKPWGKPYKVIMHAKRKPHIPIPLKSVSDRIGYTPKDVAQLLLEDKFPKILDPHNPYQPSPFLTQTTIDKYTFDPSTSPCPNIPTPSHIEITPEDISAILRKRNNQTSPGNDSIPYKYLKITNKMHPTLISAS